MLPERQAKSARVGALVAARRRVGNAGGAEDGVDAAHAGGIDGRIALLLQPFLTVVGIGFEEEVRTFRKLARTDDRFFKVKTIDEGGVQHLHDGGGRRAAPGACGGHIGFARVEIDHQHRGQRGVHGGRRRQE
ncbi:hypothetical protein CHR90_18530 [Elstera cyanobacteriorum]|uniref:Uncharacterized protein n=1 Tax=Elstera cyanobacteriorum TaxID=2022747 RepID=A0A255XJ15_9PROT|nr:hypothetical protein CHR90_18530 [Elstera cyanobacteriorum]